MIHIQRAIDSVGTGARMLLQVHDELLFEVPRGEEDATLELVRTHMEGPPSCGCHSSSRVVSARTGSSASERSGPDQSGNRSVVRRSRPCVTDVGDTAAAGLPALFAWRVMGMPPRPMPERLRTTMVPDGDRGALRHETAAAGTDGIYKRNRIEQHFRDANLLRQHGFVSESRFETVGQVILGLPPDLGFVAL